MPVETDRMIFVYGDAFWLFYRGQSKSVQDKIDWVIDVVRVVPVVPVKFLKHIEGTEGLYEIRVRHGKSIFRIFCFFERGNLVILLGGFRKQSNKIPAGELDKALRLQQQYYEDFKEK